MSEQVMGYWHRMKQRCDKCNRSVDNMFMVSSGPCTGKFCSRQHYLLARKDMEDAKRTTDDQPKK